MNDNEPIANDSGANGQIMKTLRRQQRWASGLTVFAGLLWLLAMAGSILTLWAYVYMYLPKAKETMIETQKLWEQHSVPPNRPQPPPVPTWSVEQAAQTEAVMSRVVSVGVVAVAITVVILSLATLTTLILVSLTRRVTLRHINSSLAQISQQIKALEAKGP